MPLSAEQFAKAVITAGLSTPDEIKAFWNALPPGEKPKDGETFAARLIEKQRLTQFQAGELLTNGKTPLVLGDYILLAKIGAGGMGQVFQARHRRMKRLVALKLLPTALAHDADAIARFEREVEAAAKLSHPNIVQAFDASEQRGVWYLAMEYVEGRDLAAVTAEEGPLPIGRACDFIRQAARGLAYAHENGVVHRDIKPSNLLLDRKGVIKILDMGLARFEDPAMREGLTQSGMVMGTVDYMAPEQAAGAKGVDGRADTYSLGCTLYRLLTGRNVFEGETLVQKLLAHQTQPIPRLVERRPDAPPELIAIFERMVAKRPDDRYPRLSEVEAALAPFAAVRNVPAPTEAFPASGGSTFATPTIESTTDGVHVQVAPSVAAEPAVTVNLTNPLQSTDPVSERSLMQVREATPAIKKAAALPPRRRNPWLIAAGGLGGLLLLLLGVWVIVRNKDGQEIARIQVPEGGQAEVTSNPPTVPTTNSGANSQQAGAPPIAKAPFTAAEAKAHQEAWAKHLGTTVESTNSVGQKMILIPPGEFLMGNSVADIEQLTVIVREHGDGNRQWIPEHAKKTSTPQHRVELTKPYLLAATEVTVAQFRQFIEETKYQTDAERYGFGNSGLTKLDDSRVDPTTKGLDWKNPGYSVADDQPVSQVTPKDAEAYCDWLSQKEKAVYGLPTEAEWEFACRAGTTTPYFFGADDSKYATYAWCHTNAGGKPQPVATKLPNPFGLFDMHGNLTEYCADIYDSPAYASRPASVVDPIGTGPGTTRAQRGQSWRHVPYELRSASRYGSGWSNRHDATGFRVVRRWNMVPPLAKAPFDTTQAKAHQEAWAKHLGTQVETTNSVGAKMILIPPGEFLMGSSDEDIALALKIAEETKLDAGGVNCIQHERPQHLVRITKPFRLGMHEVTIGQFGKFIEQSGYKTQAEEFGGNSDITQADDPRVTPESKKLNWRTPGHEAGENTPVTQVSGNDAIAFCNWLSVQEKLAPSYVREGSSWALVALPQGYRLPTEAEWEYACRAGTTTQFSFGDDWKEHDKYGWSNGNAGRGPRGVGLLPANPFGLYDMHGNVWEWCHDWYDGKWYALSPSDDPRGPPGASDRVLRGGGWSRTPAYGRSSYRNNFIHATASRHSHGFRIALSGDAVKSPTANAPTANAASSTEASPTETAKLLHTLPGGDIDFLLDNKLRVGRSLYDAEAGELLRDLIPKSEIRALAIPPAISQNGNRLAWITQDDELTVWDNTSNSQLWTEKLDPEGPFHLIMSADGGRLAVATTGESLKATAENLGARKTKVRIWNVAPFKLLFKVETRSTIPKEAFQFSPSGNLLLAGAYQIGYLWDVNVSHVAAMIRYKGWPKCAAFSADESHVIVTCTLTNARVDTEWTIYDLAARSNENQTEPDAGDYIANLDGNRVLCHRAGKLYVFDLKTKARSEPIATADSISKLATSHDGRLFAIYSETSKQTTVYRLPFSKSNADILPGQVGADRP